MDMTLVDLCKQLRVNGVYAYVEEYQPDNPDLERFLTSALQAELDKRHINRQMKALRKAGFPTKKRFEELVLYNLPQDGRDALPALKALTFLNGTKECHSHRKFRNWEDAYGDCNRNTRL